MSSKTLRATVKLDTKGAETSLKRLESKIKAVNKAINSTSTGNNKLNTAINKAVTSTNKLEVTTRKLDKTTQKVAASANKVNDANVKAANSARRIRDGYNSSNTAASKLLRTMKSLAGTYLGIMGAKAIIGASDTITSAENRLNNLPGATPEQTKTNMDKMYSAAQRSRSGYGDMLSNVSKSMTLAGGSFQNNIDNAIKFQEIMAKAYTIGGASAAEQSSSMYQLIQALGSGVLQGDELRSVREGAPIAYKAIEEFAQGVLNTEESLKDLASQGKITSDMVVAAIMNSEQQINKSFENTQMTFAQAWESIKNMALQAFRPVLQMFNDALNSDVGQAIIDGLGKAFVFLANLILWVSNLFRVFFNWVGENWYWLQWIVYAVISAIIIYYTVLAAKAVWSAMKSCYAFLMGLSPLYLWIIVIGLVVAALVWLTGSIEDACGVIVGAIMTAVAFIWNVIVGVLNAIIQYAWTQFVEPWIGIIEWVLNVFNGGFNSFGDAVKNLLGNIISWFLSLGQVVTKIIDAIFGTNWTGGLESLKGKVLEWGKNENAITLNREAPTLSSMTNGAVDRWAYSDAYETGNKWGVSGANWISDKLSGIGDYLKSHNDANLAVGGSYLPGDVALSTDDFLKGLDGIGSDVGDIKDSMDLSNDDLEYLRKIADMEWRNEFTTAEIRVDMTNNNTVNGERDLDGIVEYLSDVLRNEMTNVAYGVHY